MRVLLMGATGLLGNNVLETLLKARYDVTMIVRNPDSIVSIVVPEDVKQKLCQSNGDGEVFFNIQDSEIRVIKGNLTDVDLLCYVAKGCDAIINCAGDTDMSHRHLEDYYAVNRDLCAKLLKVAANVNIATIVHVSTANTIGYGSFAQPAAEQAPMQPPFTKSWYALSKLEGERILVDDWTNTDIRVVVLNPGYIIGKYDVKPSSGKLLMAGWRKRIMLVPPGGKSFVSATTVARAAVAALSKGVGGERYLVTGENLTFRQLFQIEARIGGYRQYIIVLPRGVCRLAGVIGDLIERCGIKVSFTSRNVNQLLVHEYYSNRKMVGELGVEHKPIAEAIEDFLMYKGLRAD